MVYQEEIRVRTQSAGEMHDITREVVSIVRRSGIQIGLAQVFNVGSTACIGTIEYEDGLVHDLPTELNRLLPPGKHYGHEQTWHDGNGHSHLQATLMGPETSVPIRDGQLILGTWQQLFHLECDIKPRERTIIVTVIGEAE